MTASVYLSPHLDDVALSCGGQIAQRARTGDRVTVVTLFAGDPPQELSALARRLHRAGSLGANAVNVRRREDETSCSILGAEPTHWAFTDALYRRDAATGDALYPTLEALFQDPVEPDQALTEELAERLREAFEGVTLYAPLAVGGHVDHRLTRAAAERAFGGRLAYYEDFPYVLRPGALETALGDAEPWRSEVVALERDAVKARIAAIGAHRSQLRPLFGARWRMRLKVARAVRHTGGERLWRKGQSATE